MRKHHQKTTAEAPLRTPKSSTTWDEAFLRVESYLRAFGLESRVRLNQITSEIIEQTRTRWLEDESVPPVLLAMQITRERIERWLAKVQLTHGAANDKADANARVALILADLPGRWSDCFLNAGALPNAFTDRVNSASVLPTPELRISTMPPATLEFGGEPPEPGLGAWRTNLFSRAALAWVFVLGLFSAAWAASH